MTATMQSGLAPVREALANGAVLIVQETVCRVWRGFSAASSTAAPPRAARSTWRKRSTIAASRCG